MSELSRKALMVGNPSKQGFAHYQYTFTTANGKEHQGPVKFARHYSTMPTGNPHSVSTIYVADVDSVFAWVNGAWVDQETVLAQEASDRLIKTELAQIFIGLANGKNPFRNADNSPRQFDVGDWNSYLKATLDALTSMPIEELIQFRFALSFLDNITPAQVSALGYSPSTFASWKNDVTAVVTALNNYTPITGA